MKQTDFICCAKRTIAMEAEAVSGIEAQLGQNFEDACNLLLSCEGRIIVTGMGKSGHIGRKVAATLASTGAPSFFVHPGEASHGDMGMITAADRLIALSNSGETPEVITLIPLLKRIGVPFVSITAVGGSTLSQQADVALYTGVQHEACPLGLAPTSSTTAQLVLGDALAIALLEARGFSAEDFAFSHPGGSLGRKLLLKAGDIMHSGSDVPIVGLRTSLKDALLEVTQKRLGMTAVVDSYNKLIGIFTDGDLRRALDQDVDINSVLIEDVMTLQCTRVTAERLAAECLQLMDTKKINALVVVDINNQPIGALNMHDLLKAGVL